ncbi:hypothetical protein SK128_010165 [Halocaridina rubra]|uniref:Uncharacterized protein n=1 Tax=Halocaridina rubra TaxID=373956 RepID=A0AAN8XHQ0_HALRR
MTGRGGLVTASTGGGSLGGSNVPADPNNQPMDLAQKTTARPLEGGGIVKSGTTLVHYTTGGVAQILTTSGTNAHVVTAKPVGRTESMGVGGQTVTLLSRTSATSAAAALNLTSHGHGGGTGPSVRSVSNTSCSTTAVTSASPAHLAYHIPRGAAAVANMAAPRSQVVATPIARTAGQAVGQPGSSVTGPRGSLVGQRAVPVSSSSGWGRGIPTTAHTGKVSGPSMHPGVSASSLSTTVPRVSVPVQRQLGGSTTAYSAGVRPVNMPAGSIRGQTPSTAMRGMISGDSARGSGAKAVHISQPIVQPQKYGSNLTGVMGSGGRTVSSGPGSTLGPAGTIYTPGNPLVTTVAGGPGVSSQGSLRGQAPQTIAVRITTAPPVPSDTSSQVTSQAATSIGAIAMTSPSGATGATAGTILTHHATMQRSQQEHHVPLKTPIGIHRGSIFVLFSRRRDEKYAEYEGKKK